MTQEEILTRIAQTAPDLSAVDVEIISADKDQTCLTAVCLRTEADRLEEALRASGFFQTGTVLGEDSGTGAGRNRKENGEGPE